MSKATNMTQDKTQAVWFLIVGASAALVHFLVLVACVQFASIVPVLANVIAFFVAFFVSFAGHFHLTFATSSDKKEQIWLKSLPKWFASSVGGFLLNQALFVLGIYWLGNEWYALIWFVATGVVTVMTFALGKLWAFK